MKRTGFKKTYGTFKLKSRKPLRRTKLRLVGKSTTTQDKIEIQALLREIAILRDGGCIFRDFPESGRCGGYRKDGELILQFDHLNSRVHSISYGDSRLGICACQRHHIFWKKQEPDLYMKMARKNIGTIRSYLLDRVQADRRPYKADWKLVIIGLKQELAKLREFKKV